MRIAIIGAGHIGGTLASHLARRGHEIALSNSRGPDTLREQVGELGEHARAMTADAAAELGELVIVSIPFGRYREVPARPLAGKVVIDTNNYYPERDGRFEELDEDRSTSSELLARHLAGAQVVKAFNAIRWESLRDKAQPDHGGERVGIPISGDDADAKEVVARLVDEIGFDAVDAGTLAEGGRKHQPGADVYTADLPSDELRHRLTGVEVSGA